MIDAGQAAAAAGEIDGRGKVGRSAHGLCPAWARARLRCFAGNTLVAVTLGSMLAGCAVKVQPLSEQQLSAFALERLANTSVGQESITHPIPLYEAMARALKYNLDVKVEGLEQSLRVRQLALADQSMIPDLVAGSGYSGRNEGDASSSSTRDPDVVTADLTFSWNILDFGLSYLRAKEAADQVLVQQEAKRKVINRLIEDVRTAYWRAASYERLVGRMRTLEASVAQALNESRQISSSGQDSPLVALTYERELLEIQGEIDGLEGDLLQAKTQLAALMNVTPGTEFSLVPNVPVDVRPTLPADLPQLYSIAVVNRPEMREIAYQLRINDRELDISILKLLPNFNLYAGLNYDSNQFISPNDWVSWGGKVTWNLLKMVTLPATKHAIDAQGDALKERALSVSMAVMTQVQISRVQYAHLLKRYKNAQALAWVNKEILNQINAQIAADRATRQNLIREQMNSLLADAKQDLAYADLENALANMYASIGYDAAPATLDVDHGSIQSIATALQARWEGSVGGPNPNCPCGG
jgi:outer membrane protein TolC